MTFSQQRFGGTTPLPPGKPVGALMGTNEHAAVTAAKINSR